MTRTLFGHPIRESTTAAFFPNKLTLDEFVEHMSGSVEGFVTNMRMCPDLLKPRYIEEWTEKWLAWCEIEEERPRAKTLAEINNQHYAWFKEMGWADPMPTTILESLMLVVREAGEAADECRFDKPTERFGSELADIILRTVAIAKENGIDIEQEIERKMVANQERGTKGEG